MMPLYLIHRQRENQRNAQGAHSALVAAADPGSAIVAANGLVPSANAPFDGFAVTEVAATAGGAHADTYFDGDVVNVRGMTRGGSAI